MSQSFITPTFHIKRPGGMREAIRRPTRDGVLDTEIWNSLALVLDSLAIFGSLHPPIIPPRDPAHSAGPTPNHVFVGPVSPPEMHPKFRSIIERIWAPKMDQNASQKQEKVNQKTQIF